MHTSIMRSIVLAFSLAAAAGCAQPGYQGNEAKPYTSASSIATTMTIDVSSHGPTIPANFVGLSFGHGNVIGDGGDPIFQPTYRHHAELLNLFQQIGVKHIRTVVDGNPHTQTDAEPQTSSLDDFFAFAKQAGLGEHSIIYSLHLFANRSPDASNRPQNLPQARYIWSTYPSMLESFAFGNESDWKAFFGTDYDAYKSEWELRLKEVEEAFAAAKPAFSGPDTGSDWPVNGAEDTSVGPNGIPWSLQFAHDESARINLATQHYYGGSSSVAPTWMEGAPYFVDDVVEDPKNSNFTYRCIVNDSQSNTHPELATKYWEAHPQIWLPRTTYQNGEYVQALDAKGNPTAYQCLLPTCQGTTDPRADTAEWNPDGNYPLLSGLQMARHMLSSDRLNDYAKLLDHALAQTIGPFFRWPPELPYRLTESNAFSGGQDLQSQCFATALWAVDYFHWWAVRGVAGIDPFTRLVQYNAAIFDDTALGHLVAEPLAYGMKAFAMGSDGTTINPWAISFSARQDWLTGYAVVNASHLYVTLVNKTFTHIGAVDAAVRIKPVGFAAKHARYLILAPAAGVTGDATVKGATLGGAAIPVSGAWNGTWSSLAVNSDGTVSPLTVGAANAVVVDLTN
jgi:hypothetical protein